jgi:hypothetical protein
MDQPEPVNATIVQWIRDAWSGYQQASSVLTPLENDAWLASSLLQTFMGPQNHREEEKEDTCQELIFEKPFLIVSASRDPTSGGLIYWICNRIVQSPPSAPGCFRNWTPKQTTQEP